MLVSVTTRQEVIKTAVRNDSYAQTNTLVCPIWDWQFGIGENFAIKYVLPLRFVNKCVKFRENYFLASHK